MKKILFLLVLNIILSNNASASDFNKYFKDKTLRIDYYMIGDAKSNEIVPDKIYEYGIWAGSLNNLIDEFDNGTCYLKIYDKNSGRLIFSKGYDNYFREYQTTAKARKGVKKAYHESALIPSPKGEIIFAVEKRDKSLKLNEIFRTEINPDDISVNRNGLKDESVRVYDIQKSGDPHKCVDIAVIAEGYTAFQAPEAIADVQSLMQDFFSMEPYKSNRDKFNIYCVLKPSPESGVDEPRAGIFKKTSVEATFNSLNSERYLLTEDNKALRDIAAQVPYDAVMIMVNSKRYGGGGIYNFYCTFTAKNQWAPYLVLHEFGHSFAGLADEYYTSATAYDDFYPPETEPKEPNITALLEPNKLKWRKLKNPGLDIPSNWNKAKFDSVDTDWQKQRREMNGKIAELKKNKAGEREIAKAEAEYAAKDKEHALWVDSFLKKDPAFGKVGAFEGAGYASEGLYRPMVDCIMFTKGKKPYCKVCEKAVLRMIQYYTE